MQQNISTVPRVLVIDDNPAIHEDFRTILCPVSTVNPALDEAEASLFGETAPNEKQPVFEMDCASQGQEGLEKVRNALAEGRPYALAFVDGRMPPGWDGVETIGHLWQMDPNLQIVICTAFSDYSWEEIIHRVGQSDSLLILKKPFDTVEVLQMAHAMSRKWQLGQEARAHLGRLNRLVEERTIAWEDTNEHLILTKRRLEAVTLKANQVMAAPARPKADSLGHLSAEMMARTKAVMTITEALSATRLTPEQLDCIRTIDSNVEALLALLTTFDDACSKSVVAG